MADVELKDRLLKQFTKALRGNLPVGRVGILSTGPRAEGNLTNVQVGAAHEYGTSKLPMRSFLRQPITDNLETKLEQGGFFDEAAVKQVIREGKVTEWVRRIGVAAEAVVLEAFDTGGGGKWAPSDMSKKKNGQTLVETQQLRNSISSDVKDG